jgi:phosphoglycolate phosphatase-like HAD superfamily hydrolase
MTKSKKKGAHDLYIGFDMDGVIIDHTLNKIRLAEKLGYQISEEQTPPEVMRTVLPTEARHQLQEILYHDPMVAFKSSVMRGTKPALREIVKKQIPFVLISRRKNSELAIRFLEKHGLWPEFFHAHNTFFVNEPEDKNAKAVELGVTHYLDDESRVLEKLIDVPNRFLFDKHRILPEAPHYKKVHSWMEFVTRL